MCLGSGAVLDAAMGPYRGKGGDEQCLLRSVLDTLESGDLLLGDAHFTTNFLVCTLRERGVDGVLEQQGARRRSTELRGRRRLGAHDHLIELRTPKIRPSLMSAEDYDSAPDRLTVRELYTGGKILVTALLCPQHTPKAELKALYRQRWHVGVSGEGQLIQSVKVRPRPKDSSLVAWEAPWRESKTVKPSDNVRVLAYRNVLGCNVQRT